ncbi:MAG: prepilin-type N-terminal cleavage/methylation domain-containing protein [Phycisphaerae bacterium]|nr:prepilin-type N-terminal cleavage/methylation domain-containing protein [Phycisphaerae bacterium]
MEKRDSGFTLIELLVVISIIALLVSILMPALAKSRERSRELVCSINLRSIGTGLFLYLEDNNDTTFNANFANSFFWKDTNGNYLKPSSSSAYWGVAYIDYIDSQDVFSCPSFLRTAKLIYPVDPKLIEQAAFGLNSNANNKKISQVRRPGEFIFAHDHVEPKVENGSRDMFYNDGPGTNNLRSYRQGGSREQFYRGIFRHSTNSNKPFETGGKANMLWLDGHVDNLRETTGDDVRKKWYTG